MIIIDQPSLIDDATTWRAFLGEMKQLVPHDSTEARQIAEYVAKAERVLLDLDPPRRLPYSD